MTAIATLDNAEIIKLQTEMFLLRNKTGSQFQHRVTARFGKRRAPKILKDGIRDKHTIKASKVADSVSARSIGSGWNRGIIVNAKSRQKGIEHWKVSPRRTAPSRRIGRLRTETQKGKQAYVVGVFSGRPKQGDRNFFFKRVGRKRLPLKRIVGPSLFVMYKRNEAAILDQYERGFVKEAIDSIESVKRRMAK